MNFKEALDEYLKIEINTFQVGFNMSQGKHILSQPELNALFPHSFRLVQEEYKLFGKNPLSLIALGERDKPALLGLLYNKTVYFPSLEGGMYKFDTRHIYNVFHSFQNLYVKPLDTSNVGFKPQCKKLLEIIDSLVGINNATDGYLSAEHFKKDPSLKLYTWAEYDE